MKNKVSYYCWLLLMFVGCTNANHTGRTCQTNNTYQQVNNWPGLDSNFVLGNPTGIGIDTNQHILVFHRADRKWPTSGIMPSSFIASNTVLILDNITGKIINSWGADRFIMPHGLTVDDQNNVWLTDVGLHQVFKFTIDGKLLMSLGEARIAGADSAHFNLPTDVAVAKDGSFYVTDGYGNSRVVKFSTAGKYLFEWGTKGSDTNQFKIPHGVCIDDKNNLYVADRENNRIQVFDNTGKFLAEWKNKSTGRICGVSYDAVRNRLIAVDDQTTLFNLKHLGSDIIIFTMDGNIESRFGRSESYNGPICWYHDVTIDRKGIFIQEIF